MSNMNKELVSVIMPTYNAGKYLSDSIGSILAQTYENLELLITDDGSTEERTLQLLKEFCEKDPRVKVVYLKENLGSGHSRNNAIERAEGRYIAFCDCDDRWMPEKLERQIAYMQEKDCALVSSSYLICNEDSEITGINISPDKVTFGMEKRDNKIGCLTAVYDTRRLGRKFLMPSIRKRQDWGLFLNILKECGVCYAITEPLAVYRNRTGSISSRKFPLVKYNVRIYHDILGYSWPQSLFYFLFFFLPTYGTKVLKRKVDSYRLMKQIKQGKKPF